tara:strand:- start:500 stop:748 length:249 start_codon:yes stop_codon:yes gene_type:complete
MAKFSITMPDDLGAFVHEEMAERSYENVSEYFRHLVRQERRRAKADDDLRGLIDEGLKSGVSGATLDDIWAEAGKKHGRTGG